MSTVQQSPGKAELSHHFEHAPPAHVDSDSKEETRGFALQRTDDNEEPTLHLRTIMVIVSLCFAAFAINIGVTGTGFWLAYVIGSFGPSPDAVFFAVGWLILQVAITPILGLMSDFGAPTRKWLCVGLMIPAIIGCCIAASADSWDSAIPGMCLFGTVVVSYGPQAAIASDIVPRRMRGFIQGILYSSQAMGSITGSLAGGAMIQNNTGGRGGWRWVLYLAAIALGIAAAGITLFYRPIPRPEIKEPPYLKRVMALDWVGTILFSCGMVPFLLGILWGGAKYPWSSAPIIASLVVGFFFFIVFGLHQAFVRKDGVFNHRLFKQRNFPIALVTIFVEGIVYITLNTFLGQQIAILYETEPIKVGSHFTVILICASVSASAWGYYSHKTKQMRFPLLFGYGCFIAACIGFSQAPADIEKGRMIMYGCGALVGIGLGPPLALILAVAQLAVDPDLTGIASSLVIGIRSWGGATGASIGGAIFTAKITKNLPEYVAKAAIAAGASPSDVGGIIGFITDHSGAVPAPAGVTPAQLAAAGQGLREAYASSFAFIYYEMLPWAAAAFILLCFLKPVNTSMTWSITTPAENYDQLGVHRAVNIPGNSAKDASLTESQDNEHKA